jgi:hypothetical protein
MTVGTLSTKAKVLFMREVDVLHVKLKARGVFFFLYILVATHTITAYTVRFRLVPLHVTVSNKMLKSAPFSMAVNAANFSVIGVHLGRLADVSSFTGSMTGEAKSGVSSGKVS